MNVENQEAVVTCIGMTEGNGKMNVLKKSDIKEEEDPSEVWGNIRHTSRWDNR